MKQGKEPISNVVAKGTLQHKMSKSMIVKCGDFVLGRCPWLLQVRFTFILEKDPQGEELMFISNFFPLRWKESRHSFLARTTCSKAPTHENLVVLGCHVFPVVNHDDIRPV